MRQLKNFWLLLLPLMMVGVAHAQDVHIVYPQEGQDVRGEITARFEGIPAGGYAQVSIDGQFRQATAQNFVVLDTISDRVTFSRADSAYRMDITVLNAGGKRVGTDSVTFNVANNKVDPQGQAVKLVHWTEQDRLDGRVQRYRVFAESDATITDPTTAGGAGGASSGGEGGASAGAGAGASAEYLPAPLDWQVSALLRRVVRDTNMMSNSANISTIVQDGFERQRLSETSAAGGEGGAAPAAAPAAKKKGAVAAAVPVKAPWNQDDNGGPTWNVAPETGKFYIKMIQQDGTEINATRKATTIAIADLLPTFPTVPVRPGSTWETTMSFVGDLSTRTPINVKAPITFTAYEDIQTPAGENRRCAKLESRFLLPDNLAKRIAANLGNKMGTAGASGVGGGSEGGAPSGSRSGPPGLGGAAGGAEGGAGATLLTEDDIEVARTLMVRVIWFDVERRRILRAEDTIQSNFEIPAADTGVGSEGGPGGPAGASSMPRGGLPGASGADAAATAPAEPTKVDYQLKLTTWMDDRIPPPSTSYVPGGGAAHAHDSVSEPGLSRILGTGIPAR